VSYCRLLEADVYLFLTPGRGDEPTDVIECCGCALTPGSHRARSYAAILAHVGEHRKAGHYVPDWVDEQLRTEQRLPLDDPERGRLP
jgi:hypothetical protein